ncbi:hypothetical protein NQ317_018285 [Molorchus minor]|uniref:Uncharacterized protein n=1 Tax=Molorchus minor TaxID=1323400 RepID=A0ABQ9K3S6_9CUCU|nr:hypothetical protein NQ317_018285 [Molorchus minor]
MKRTKVHPRRTSAERRKRVSNYLRPRKLPKIKKWKRLKQDKSSVGEKFDEALRRYFKRNAQKETGLQYDCSLRKTKNELNEPTTRQEEHHKK